MIDSMASDVGPFGLATFFSGATTVSLATPQEMRDLNQQGLSVWLYRVARDENRLNDPPEVRTLPGGGVEVLPTPLPVRLHYLMTPLASASPDTSCRCTEHLCAAKCVRYCATGRAGCRPPR